MKIEYKIYPEPSGRWRCEWRLDGEQSSAATNLSWYGTLRPGEVYVFRATKNRDRERIKLERKCKKYADLLCETIEEERKAERLRVEAPLIEHGCDS